MKTIFYAEDEQGQREMLEFMLSRDYEVHTFDDGLPLYEALRQARPDLIITDGNMPNMRGYEVLKKAIAEGYNGHAIIFSMIMNEKDHEDVEQLKKRGVSFVEKPNINKLTGLVKRILDTPTAPPTAQGTGDGSYSPGN